MTDLHAMIMAQMRNLANAEGTESLEMEIKRSQAMANMGNVVVNNLKVAQRVQQLRTEFGRTTTVPRLLPPEGES